ncbi:uncharacterized protein LOC126664982 [Mercurialis annua]|uniref:uncharacterized protein LOC126664982 n=1 Tax=Mercurialis annua TaxID=3986 RepID=UPI00216088F9|nr:uncharacterized protein LOC126664982 [Mercurialis annua]
MQGVDLWSVFLRGWKHLIDKDGALLKREWSKDQVKENNMIRKTIATLISSISREKQGIIQNFTCAKQIWETLENYHESTTQVKAKKLQLLLGEYKGFKFLPHEDVTTIEEALDLSTLRMDELIENKKESNEEKILKLTKRVKELKCKSGNHRRVAPLQERVLNEDPKLHGMMTLNPTIEIIMMPTCV